MPFGRLNRNKSLSRIQGTYDALDETVNATGGVISDYDDGSGNKYRAHIFTSTGALTVSSITPGIAPATINYSPSSVTYRKIGQTAIPASNIEYLVVSVPRTSLSLSCSIKVQNNLFPAISSITMLSNS